MDPYMFRGVGKFLVIVGILLFVGGAGFMGLIWLIYS